MGQAGNWHTISTQMSHPIGQNSITWPYSTVINDEKCGLENKEMDFSEHVVVSAMHMF